MISISRPPPSSEDHVIFRESNLGSESLFLHENPPPSDLPPSFNSMESLIRFAAVSGGVFFSPVPPPRIFISFSPSLPTLSQKVWLGNHFLDNYWPFFPFPPGFCGGLGGGGGGRESWRKMLFPLLSFERPRRRRRRLRHLRCHSRISAAGANKDFPSVRRRLPSSARQRRKRKLMGGNHRCSLSPPPEIMNHKVVQTIREMTLLNLRPPVGGGRSSSNLPFPSFVGGRLAARPKGQVDEGRDSSWALDKQFRPADVSSSYLSFSTGVDRIKWTS